MEGYDGPAQPRYATEEAKREVEPLREVLARAVSRLEKELDMLRERIAPVLRMDEPRAERPDLMAVTPHSSEVAKNVYQLHQIADDIAALAHRVEL